MSHDKKRLGQTLRLVLPVEVGEVIVADDIDNQDILDTLHEMAA